MNFLELYSVCKDYTIFVEEHMKSVRTLSVLCDSETFEDFVNQVDMDKIDLEHDSIVFDELMVKAFAIKNPIREEVAEDILNSIERSKNLPSAILPSESITKNNINDGITDEEISEMLEMIYKWYDEE